MLIRYTNVGLRKKHFYQRKDNKTRSKSRPTSIPREEFQQLLTLWNNKNVAKRCLRAKEIGMSKKNMHTAGPKSFARICDEMKNDDPNKELPSLTQLFERTRKRTEVRAYVDTYDDTTKKNAKNICLKCEKRLKKTMNEKKVELQAMQKDLDNQRETCEAMRKDIVNERENFEATVRKLMEQIPLESREFLA